MFRKVFITTSLLLLFLAFMAYNGWHLFKLNAGMKRILLSKLRTTIGQDCNIERLRLGLGSVNLGGVKLVFQDSPYEVWIDELRLGFSIRSLLNGKGNLQKTAEEITFYRPRLILTYDSTKRPQPEVDLSLQLTSETEKLYRSIIQEYDFIKRITISEGEIALSNSESREQTRVAKRINGWAYADNNDQVWLRMAGHVFDSEEYNLVLYGQFDVERGGLDFINVDLHDYKLSGEIPFLIPDYIEVIDGVVSSHLVVTERRQPTRGFDVEGTLSLKDGRFKLASENLNADDILVEAEIKDWNLEIKKATQSINGSRTKLEGRINNLLDPEVDLRLSADRLDVGVFLKEFFPDQALPFSGSTECNLLISEKLANPEVAGTLQSDSLWFHDKKISNFKVDLGFRDFALVFENISGAVDSSLVTGAGTVDFRKPERWLDFRLNLHGDFTEKFHQLGFSASDRYVTDSEIIILGPAVDPVSRGHFTFQAANESAEPLVLEGSFQYSDGNVTVSATTLSKNDKFDLSVSADNVFKNPEIRLEADHFEKLFAFIDHSKLGFISKRYDLNLRAEGGRDKVHLVLDGFDRSNRNKIFQIKTDSTSSFIDHVVTGDIILFPQSDESVKGEFDLQILDDKVRLSKLFLGEWLNGTIDFSRSTLTPYDGKLTISDLKLSLILAALGKLPSHYDGDLYGQISFANENDQPKITGNLWLLDGFFRDVGPIKGEFSFLADPTMVDIEKLSLDYSESTSVLAKGNYDLRNDDVDVTITGSNVNVNDVVSIVTGERGLVDGNATAQVKLRGSANKMPLSGRVEVDNARILMFEFDRAEMEFGELDASNGSYVSAGELSIQHAVLDKFGKFSLAGKAKLPLNSQNHLDVQMSGSGDFLALLTDLQDIFEDTKSTGHLNLHLAGQYKEPNFSGTKFACKEGTLQLTSVVDKVENLEAELEVLSEDYFLDIKKLEGKIKGAPFSISNRKAISSPGNGGFEPLRIAGDDLNLGALVLSTSSTGVPLSVPGLMEQGEAGWYSFGGRTAQEPFFIAGPWQRPHLRGEVVVHNANLMFPFDESAAQGNQIVLNILDNINWDVHAVSGKDTRYVMQFSTAVYVNMEVEQENSNLDFQGVLKDSTFSIEGKVESTRGEFEYIDLNFRVEKFGADFNRSSLFPLVYGKAWTVVRDSSNVPNEVYLTLYTVDETNHEQTTGRWDRINIKLSSEFPGYEETQGQLMATLGYTSDNVQEHATKAVAYSTDKLLFRPLMRPVERQLERRLGLDVVRFSYAITQNFLDANFNNEELQSSLALLRSSRLVLGKYLTNDLYLLYSGELKAGIDYQFQDKGVGLQHIFGLEYRLNSRWLFQMEYDYNTLLETSKDDKKLWLRHSFPF